MMTRMEIITWGEDDDHQQVYRVTLGDVTCDGNSPYCN